MNIKSKLLLSNAFYLFPQSFSTTAGADTVTVVADKAINSPLK